MISMRFEGGDKLAAELRKLSERVSKGVLREALRNTSAPPIQRTASALAPRGPGSPDIANNIVISTGRASGAHEAAIVIGPSTGTRSDQPSKRFDEQGLHLEFGTSDTRMQPSLRPAFDQEAAKTLGPFGGAIWQTLIGKGIGSARSSGGGGGLL